MEMPTQTASAIFVSVMNIMSSKIQFTTLWGPELLEGIGNTTLLCVAGSHIFFNLKEAAEHGVNVGTNWASYSHSAIRFDEQQFEEDPDQ